MSFYPVNSTSESRFGRVANAGNTCTSSVLLQELSAFSEIYEPLLQPDLLTSEAQRELLLHLAFCVQELKSGRSVTYNMVTELNLLLIRLGWLKENLSLFHQYFYPLSAFFSPLPSGSPYDLSELALSMLKHIEGVIVLEKGSNESFQEAILNAFPKIDLAPHCLWRVAKEYQEEVPFEDSFSMNGFTFTLKMVLSCQRKSSGNHVVAYRRLADQWMLLDDSKVIAVHAPSTIGVYMVLYEAMLMDSGN